MFLKPEILLFFKNNKRVLILAIIGVVLLFLGNFVTQNDRNNTKDNFFVANELINERKLEQILSNIDGAGKVKVFITYENKGMYEYAMDSKIMQNSNSDEKKHVFSNKEPIIKSFTNAEIRGILATATGAGDMNVKNRLLKSIKAATGVGLDKINIELGVK